MLQRGLARGSVFGLIDTPVEDDSGKVVLARARGELRFEGVGLTLSHAHQEPALAGIDLEVHPGEDGRWSAARAAARRR